MKRIDSTFILFAACAVLLLLPAIGIAQSKVSKLVPAHASMGGSTRCELCHTTSGWAGANFAHERTGFPLVGRHQSAPCQACHMKDFKAPLPRICAGCHRDVHRGELGQRCEGCHTPASWQSEFSVDAHRRTAFPLDGRHATIPCTECHGEARDHRFSRPVVGCMACHADDYARTGTSGIDHAAVGFPTDCQLCHSPYAFRPARFPEHDRCFVISRGHHANIACNGCHTGTPSVSGTFGACATFNAACSNCHEHSCSRTDAQHREVAGYQCVDRKCYECHRFGGGGD